MADIVHSDIVLARLLVLASCHAPVIQDIISILRINRKLERYQNLERRLADMQAHKVDCSDHRGFGDLHTAAYPSCGDIVRSCWASENSSPDLAQTRRRIHQQDSSTNTNSFETCSSKSRCVSIARPILVALPLCDSRHSTG